MALGGGITAAGEPQPATVAEATAMAQIAVPAGVPPGSITAETRSRDTIGNVWFTKPLPGDRGSSW